MAFKKCGGVLGLRKYGLEKPVVSVRGGCEEFVISGHKHEDSSDRCEVARLVSADF